MLESGRSLLWRLSVTVAITAAALAARALLDPWLGNKVPFITLFAAVAAVAWLAGSLPALLATAIGALGALYLWPDSSPVVTTISLLAFVATAGIIIWLVQRAQRHGDRAQQAAAALDRHRTLLQHMIDSLPMLVAYVDRERRYRLNNRTYGEWFGADAATLEGRRVEEVVGSAAYARARPFIDRVLAGESLRFEASLAYPNGARDVSITFAPHVVGEKVEGYFAIIEDISERKATEHARAHLAAIVASSTDAIISKSLEGIVQSWNAGAERLFGWRADEIIGKSITLLIPPEREHEEPIILARLARGEQLTQIETERMHRDGFRFPVSLTISPVYDSDGRVVGASKIARDISERRRVEAEREAEARRKDEFLATLAHELRNPLAPILTAAQAMPVDPTGDPDILAARNMIERQARHMTRLVDDLLDLSRITRGQVVLRRARVALHTALDAALESCRPMLRNAEVRLQPGERDESLIVDGDSTRLAQIISNLVGNAAKFTPRGGTVCVSLRRDGDDARIVVEDDGIGIDPTKLEQIFDMFVQVGASTERPATGLGIGLSLARKFAELHGGAVTAHSDGPGRGSRFDFSLPLATADATTVVPAERAAVGASLRILIADDNVDAAHSLSLLLRLDGHRVDIVNDGMAAVSSMTTSLPDVGLIDIGMPGLDGYEVARRVRALPGGDRVRLVALTGWGQDDARRRSHEAGFDAHLTKPADAAMLNRTLQSLCQRRSAV